MKIALVHMRHAHTGGTERYLTLLALELAEHGHEVSIVCRSFEKLDHPNIRFVTLRPFSLGKAHRMWRFAKAVEQHVQGAGYDLVYGLGKTWAHDVIRIGGGSHKRFLAQMPEQKGLRLKDRISMALEAKAFRPGGFRLVIANSQMCAKEIAEDFSIAEDKVRVIHNSVSLDRFQREPLAASARALRESFGIGDGELLYLFLGTGYQRKGLDLLLRAFSQAAFASPAPKLLVVGYDSNLADYQQLAKELGVSDRVIFAGGRRDAEVCYAAADVYVLPTRYDPFANTTLEALAAGLPVITSETNGGCEVLHRGIGDIVALDKDCLSLTKALERWQDSDLRLSARTEATLCASHYTHTAVMCRTRELLEKIAADKATERRSARQD